MYEIQLRSSPNPEALHESPRATDFKTSRYALMPVSNQLRVLTVQGRLADAILARKKCIENRNYSLRGPVLIHKGKGNTPPRWKQVIDKAELKKLPANHIVGLVHFDGPVSMKEVEAKDKEWAAGPVCNYVRKVILFDKPIPGHRGNVGLQPIKNMAVMSAVTAQLAVLQAPVPPPAAVVRAVQLGLRMIPREVRSSFTTLTPPSSVP